MIHPQAIIEKAVILGQNVKIGPYAVLEKGVILGNNVVVSPFVHLKGNTYIGEDTFIGTGAVIGEGPQMLGVKESIGKVQIGRNNIIREYVTINSASSADKATILGDDNFLMAFSHIAHDCKIGNKVVICNGVLFAGFGEVQDGAFISGYVIIHQFVRIGRLTIISGLARINQDVPPFMMVVGDSRVWGLNLVGLRRAGFNRNDIKQIRKAHNFIYRKGLPLKKALAELEKIESDKVKEMIIFILSSMRGICGPQKGSFFERLFLDYPYFLRSKIPTNDLFLKSKQATSQLKESV